MQGGSECLDEQRLLLGEDGAEVENEAVVFDAGDHGNTGGGAAQTLLKFSRRITGAGDADDFGWQRLRRGGAAARERSAIGNFDLDFIERKFGTQLANEILGAALQFLRGRTNHAHNGNFIPRGTEISAESGFECR